MQPIRQAPIKPTILAIIGCVILYAICVIWLDRPLAYWIKDTVAPTSSLSHFGFWVQKIAKPSHWFALGILAAIIGVVLKLRHSPKAKAWLFWGGSVIIAFIACGVLKLLIGRYRPDELFTQHLYGFHSLAIRDDSGSPSGHTTLAFAGLWSLALLWNKRWLSVILIILAGLIGLSRLAINAHFLGDIIFSIYVGVLSVYWAKLIIYRRQS